MNNEELNRIMNTLIQPVILSTLSKQPTHGYNIMLTHAKTFGARYQPSIMYRNLSELEKQNLIQVTAYAKPINGTTLRKIYSITDDGKCKLEEYRRLLKLINKNLEI